MGIEILKRTVYDANMALCNSGLVVLTWGNVSGADREAGLMAIKPSGVAYCDLTPDDIVVLSLCSGEVIGGSLKPSSDTPTHLALYRGFESIGGVVHTHSRWATSWGQADREIPCLGTTHADFAYGSVPVARWLTSEEIAEDYEENTGKVIVEALGAAGRTPQNTPAILLPGHGPFAWGKTAAEALDNAITLEEVAKMAASTLAINPSKAPLPAPLLDKHFSRKHGPDSYYGQKA